MKVAVISDIHANRQAFEATLEAIAASEAAELWCLGDLVGYGADPDACVGSERASGGRVCLIVGAVFEARVSTFAHLQTQVDRG